jgi:prophage regulatory protein
MFRTVPGTTARKRKRTPEMTKRVLRRKAVEAKTGHSASTIYEKMTTGEFPRPIKLGARAVGWIEEEVETYIETRIAERDRDPGARA